MHEMVFGNQKNPILSNYIVHKHITIGKNKQRPFFYLLQNTCAGETITHKIVDNELIYHSN